MGLVLFIVTTGDMLSTMYPGSVAVEELFAESLALMTMFPEVFIFNVQSTRF